MAVSQAHVATQRPSRYAKQLASHLGRRITTEWDHDTARGTLLFPFGTAQLRATEDELQITVEGAPEDIEQLEAVVGRHLVRFGTKDELICQWQRDTGAPGTVWRNDEDDHPNGNEAETTRPAT